MNTRSARLWFLSIFFVSSIFSISASASLKCAQSMITEVGDRYYEATGLVHYLDTVPSSYVGALKIKVKDGSQRTVVFVNGALPAAISEGMNPAGNDVKRVLASKPLVLDEWVARRSNKIFELVAWVGRWSSVALLANELLNPGLLPNNVPYLAPGLLAGMFSPNIVGNFLALKHRWFSGRPMTQEELMPNMTSYLKTYRVPKKGWVDRFVYWWRGQPLLTTLQVVAVTNPALVATPEDRQRLMGQLETTLEGLDLVKVEKIESLVALTSELQGEE